MTDQPQSQTAESNLLQFPEILNEGQPIQGPIKFFDWAKGFGFIKAQYYERDVHVSIRHVPVYLRPFLHEGTCFWFITGKSQRGIHAKLIGLVDYEAVIRKAV